MGLTGADIDWATTKPAKLPPGDPGRAVRGCFQWRRTKRNKEVARVGTGYADICIAPFGHEGPHRWRPFRLGKWPEAGPARAALIRRLG